MTTRFDTETDHSGKGSQAAYSEIKREIQSLVQPIKTQLERTLKVRENARWSAERERGSLDPRSLAKLGSQPNYRTVFREYTKTETNNVAVEILIDMSGSMGRGRMDTAKKAAVAMAEALKELNIPFEVTGFNSVPNRKLSQMLRKMTYSESQRFSRKEESLDLHIFKSFDSTSLNGITNLFVGQQNPDGECIFWAAKRLAERREKRKILLVLSDGEPATSESKISVLRADLKNRIGQLRKAGIECIGIGILTECVKNYYPDYAVITNLADLPKVTMKKLSSLIAKGAA
jgi:cobalamin biosynthesis protein CobT